MAQGSFILYGSKGKVGNLVAQRNKGKTIIREHVIPTNPRTKAQQLQRSRFGYLAKFYAEGVKQFFKFSFEKKKANESDYNAFMRENKANMFYATKQMLDNYDSCAFGPYRLTSGSIVGYGSAVKWSEQNGQLEIEVPGMTEEMTWGAISELLIAQHTGWQNGDIITFVTIADANPSATICDTVAEAVANNSYFKNNAGTIWRFVQVELNTADVNDPTEYGIGVDADKLVIVPSATDPSSSILGGGSMVVSRNTANGTMVSDSYLEIGTSLKSRINRIANDPAWIQHCADTMMASDESILQGSLLEGKEATIVSPSITKVNANGQLLASGQTYSEEQDIVILGSALSKNTVKIYCNNVLFTPISATAYEMRYHVATNGSYRIEVEGATYATFTLSGVVPQVTISSVKVGGNDVNVGSAVNNVPISGQLAVVVEGQNLEDLEVTASSGFSVSNVSKTATRVSFTAKCPNTYSATGTFSLGTRVLFSAQVEADPTNNPGAFA